MQVIREALARDEKSRNRGLGSAIPIPLALSLINQHSRSNKVQTSSLRGLRRGLSTTYHPCRTLRAQLLPDPPSPPPPFIPRHARAETTLINIIRQTRRTRARKREMRPYVNNQDVCTTSQLTLWTLENSDFNCVCNILIFRPDRCGQKYLFVIF